jgi:hypothetical protein
MTFSDKLDALAVGVMELEAELNKIAASNTTQLCRAYAAIKTHKERLDMQLDIVTRLYHKLSYELIPDSLDEGQDLVGVDGIIFRVSTQTMASIPEHKREAGYRWLAENGFQSLIRETVNPKQLSTFVKSYIEEHLKEPPEDVMTVFKRKSTRITRS